MAFTRGSVVSRSCAGYYMENRFVFSTYGRAPRSCPFATHVFRLPGRAPGFATSPLLLARSLENFPDYRAKFTRDRAGNVAPRQIYLARIPLLLHFNSPLDNQGRHWRVSTSIISVLSLWRSRQTTLLCSIIRCCNSRGRVEFPPFRQLDFSQESRLRNRWPTPRAFHFSVKP